MFTLVKLPSSPLSKPIPALMGEFDVRRSSIVEELNDPSIGAFDVYSSPRCAASD